MDTDNAWLEGLSLELPAFGSAALPLPTATGGAASLGRLTPGACTLIPADLGASAAPPLGAPAQLLPTLGGAGMFSRQLPFSGDCVAPAAAAPFGAALTGIGYPPGQPVLQAWPGTAAAHPQLMHPERAAQAALLLPGQGQLPVTAAWGPALGCPPPALPTLLPGRPLALAAAANGASSPPALLMPLGAPRSMIVTSMVQPAVPLQADQHGDTCATCTGTPLRGTSGRAACRRTALPQPSVSPSPSPTAKRARRGNDAWSRSPSGGGGGWDAAQGAGRGQGYGVDAAGPAASTDPTAASSGGGGDGSWDEPARPTRFRGVSWRKSQGRYESVAFVETRRYRCARAWSRSRRAEVFGGRVAAPLCWSLPCAIYLCIRTPPATLPRPGPTACTQPGQLPMAGARGACLRSAELLALLARQHFPAQGQGGRGLRPSAPGRHNGSPILPLCSLAVHPPQFHLQHAGSSPCIQGPLPSYHSSVAPPAAQLPRL